MKKINITNGEIFNEYISKDSDETFIPFNEAMIEGEISKDLFSQSFITLRAKIHQVNTKDYLEKMKPFIDFLSNLNNYDEVDLWFGEDLFCQTNLMVILICLDYFHYKGKTIVKIINEENYELLKIDNNISIENNYEKFLQIAINEQNIIDVNSKIVEMINNYLDFKKSNKVCEFIIDNATKLNDENLFKKAFLIGKEYGLGDLQIKKMIEELKN